MRRAMEAFAPFHLTAPERLGPVGRLEAWGTRGDGGSTWDGLRPSGGAESLKAERVLFRATKSCGALDRWRR